MGKCLLRFFVGITLIFVFTNVNAQSVAITTPVTGSSYNVGAIIPVSATATAPFLGTVNKVVFTIGSVSQTVTTSPYNANLNTSTLTAGSYTLTATNYYTPFLGTQTTISTTISITINPPPPVITYATPQIYTVGTAITPLTPTVTNLVGAIGFGNAISLTGATLNNPRGIAIDASGNVYVTNSGNNTISEYNSSGTYLGTFGTGAVLSFPKDLVFDSSGNAYVLNLGASAGSGSVYKYNSSGVYQSTILSGLNYALGMTIDASDNIYIADQGATTVKKYSTSGALLLSLPTVNLSTPLGVAVDASGNIYVLNNGSGNVTKYNSAGTFQSIFLSGYTSAQAITIDGAGNIYVGDNATTNTVYVYNQSGTLLTSKAMTDPEGIAVDSKGDMFASAYFANQMHEFNPSGGYYLNSPLPAGLNFNSSTGVITGTPTTTTATTTYTITAYNSSGSGSATVTITVTGSYGNYAFSKPITLNTASLGITSNLTNFPVLLSIQTNDLIISGACTDKIVSPNGPNYDFAFVSGGNELYYQVESYNQVTGTLLVWVQIPTLTYATNNVITFNYGSASPTVTHNTAFYENTWASDYLAVFHFNEASYTGSVTDGTAGGHTGAASGMTAADLVTGKIGTAYSFNGSSKKITTNAVSVTGAFTLSAWVNLGATGLDQKVMTNQTASGGASGGYKMGVYSTNIPESESGTAINRASTPNPTAFATGAWHYIQSVYTGATLSTYVDGAQYKILTTSNNPTANPNLYIGVGEGGSILYFNGIIDEPRVSNVAKTSDWIKAEYVDQNNPTAFTTVGATTVNVANAAAIPGALTYTWTGATSTDPTVATNWNNTTAGTTNQLPAFTGTATLVIPSGLTNYPSLTASESLYGLTIASGASINLNGKTLSVGCNIYNSSGGQILYGANNASQITWNGSLATQTYTGTNTANTAQLGSMTVNNSAAGTVTINSGPVDIYSTLTMTKGNLVVGASPAALTLKSTATQSASVAAITAGSTITGNVTVERYLTGGTLTYRGYRLLSSPVYASTVGGNNVYSLNYLKNSMYLTATTTSGGFDNIVAANPTLYLYRENLTPLYTTFLNSNFKGINNINSSPTYSMDDASNPSINIPVGNGYLCFFRGNRAATTFAAETTPTYVPQTATLSTSGTLNQGQVTVKDWFTPTLSTLSYTTASPAAVKGYNLVGNPYASSIDWETFQTTTTTTGIYGASVNPTIYVLDPVSKNYGAYIQGHAGVGTNNASNIIASGQGFFVVATCACATLIFNEGAKTSAQVVSPKLLMGKPADMAVNDQHLRLQLAKDSINTEDILVRFDNSAGATYDPTRDAPYKQGLGAVSMASIRNDHLALAINTLPLPKTSQIIGLTISAKTDAIYTLNMKEITGIPKLYDIWLMDRYKKDSLDMRHNTTYAFNLYKADTNSYGSQRFSLVIRQNPSYALRLLAFTAAKATNGAQLIWKTENEENYTKFTIERSTDNGKTFNILGSLGSDAQGTYSFMDKSPVIGTNQYRLKQEDLNGTITYSNVIPLMYSDLNNIIANNTISVYPNPTASTISLSIVQNAFAAPKTSTASYDITITNSSGLVVKTHSAVQTIAEENVSNLPPGTYIIQVVNSRDKSEVGKSKFVKL